MTLQLPEAIRGTGSVTYTTSSLPTGLSFEPDIKTNYGNTVSNRHNICYLHGN